MLYSDLYLKNRSKPPAVLFVVAVLAVLGFFVSFTRLPSAPTRASKQIISRHDITNVSPREVSIFWVTSDKTVSWVIWGDTQELNKVTLDERDLEESKRPSRYHLVRLKNLSENTTYYYKLVNNNELSEGPGNTAFSFTTPRSTLPTSIADPVYGKVITSGGEPAADTIVSLEYPGAYALMTVAKIEGDWLIPLPYLLETETNRPLTADKTTPITIRMYLDDQNATTVRATLLTASPVSKTIILGSDYDLLQKEEVLPTATGEARIQPASPVTILFPKEKSVVPGRNPLIKGLAPAGSAVTLRINTQPATSYDLQTNNRGEWTIDQPLTIAPGDYQLTVTTSDEDGKPITLRRSFSIAKSGEQVLASATSPATLTPTTPVVSPTATGVPIVLTMTPQPTYANVVTSTPAPPVSGINPGYFLAGSLLLILVGASIMFLL